MKDVSARVDFRLGLVSPAPARGLVARSHNLPLQRRCAVSEPLKQPSDDVRTHVDLRQIVACGPSRNSAFVDAKRRCKISHRDAAIDGPIKYLLKFGGTFADLLRSSQADVVPKLLHPIEVHLSQIRVERPVRRPASCRYGVSGHNKSFHPRLGRPRPPARNASADWGLRDLQPRCKSQM